MLVTVTQYAYKRGHFGPSVLLGLGDTLACPFPPHYVAGD